MYFELFKPQNWRKRSTEARRRNCAVLPLRQERKTDCKGDNIYVYRKETGSFRPGALPDG